MIAAGIASQMNRLAIPALVESQAVEIQASVVSLTPVSLPSFRDGPISGLPEIGTCMSKSAKADLEWAGPGIHNHRPGVLDSGLAG